MLSLLLSDISAFSFELYALVVLSKDPLAEPWDLPLQLDRPVAASCHLHMLPVSETRKKPRWSDESGAFANH
jgi:hypothetical protein